VGGGGAVGVGRRRRAAPGAAGGLFQFLPAQVGHYFGEGWSRGCRLGCSRAGSWRPACGWGRVWVSVAALSGGPDLRAATRQAGRRGVPGARRRTLAQLVAGTVTRCPGRFDGVGVAQVQTGRPSAHARTLASPAGRGRPWGRVARRPGTVGGRRRPVFGGGADWVGPGVVAGPVSARAPIDRGPFCHPEPAGRCGRGPGRAAAVAQGRGGAGRWCSAESGVGGRAS